MNPSFKHVSWKDLETDPFQRLDKLGMDYPWSKEKWSRLDHSQYQLFGVYETETLIGFSLFQAIPGDSQVHLLKITVDQTFHRKGLGAGLLAFALSSFKTMGIKSCFLEVAIDNRPAISLYHRFGFENLVQKKRYYSDGKDAYAMQYIID